MKRVLIFSLSYHPHIGGAEIAIKEITDRIPREEIAFDIITLRFDKHDALVEKIGNVRVYRVIAGGSYIGKILFPIFATIGAYRLHKKYRYDAFWPMMSYMLFPVVLLRFLGVRLPYVLTLQEGDTYHHMFKRLHIIPFVPLINFGFKRATVVQTISTYLGGWARTRGFKGPLIVIPNGVDVEKFSLPRVAHEGTVLVTASRLVKKNGIDTVIRALPHLDTSVTFRIFGSGPEEHMLKKLAEELGVSSRVEFLGHVHQENLPKEFQKADIFVRPSRSEGMGNAFVEAMAAGLPVIATQVGGIADFLFDEKRNPDMETTGWAVDVDNPEQIAQAVVDIIEHPEKVERVVRRARMLVREKYTWERTTRNMQERIFSIL